MSTAYDNAHRFALIMNPRNNTLVELLDVLYSVRQFSIFNISYLMDDLTVQFFLSSY